MSSFTQLFAAVKNFKDGRLRSRLAGILRSIMKQSAGVRGQRGVTVSKNRDLLQNLDLNSASSLTSVFAAKIVATHTAERNKATITLANLNVNTTVTPPSSATHFKLVQLLGVVSDLVYDDVLKAYKPVDAAHNALNEVSATDYMPVRSSQPLTVALDTTLATTEPLTDQVSVVQCLGILFFEQLGTEYYPLNQGNAMKIVDVF